MATQDKDQKPRRRWQRKRLSASNATIFVLLVIGAVVAVNLIATRVFGRLDLTENKVYTLSSASKELVRDLPDYLTVKAYISKDLPARADRRQPLRPRPDGRVPDLLEGQAPLRGIDPGRRQEAAEEARRDATCKVQKLQVQVMRSQKFEVGPTSWASASSTRGRASHPAGGAARGAGVRDLLAHQADDPEETQGGASRPATARRTSTRASRFLKHASSRSSTTTTVNPSTASIGDDVDALVVGGPKQPFDDKARQEIDGFLMKGQGVIFLADGMALSSPRGGMPEMETSRRSARPTRRGSTSCSRSTASRSARTSCSTPERPRSGRHRAGGKMLQEPPVVRGRQGRGRRQGPHGPGRRERRGLPVPQLGRAGRPAGQRQAGRRASSGRWPAPRRRPGSRPASSSSRPGRRGRGQRTPRTRAVRAGLRVPGTAAQRLRAAGAARDVGGRHAGSRIGKPVRLVVVGDSDFANDEYLQLARYLPFYQGGGRCCSTPSAGPGGRDSDAGAQEERRRPPDHRRTRTPRVRPQGHQHRGVPLAFIGFGPCAGGSGARVATRRP